MLLWFWFIVLLLLGAILVVALVSLVVATLTGAPFVPVSNKVAERMAELANLKPGDRAVDLGSGDGRIVMAMAKRGAQAEGYEIQPLLVWWSRWRIWRQGLSSKAKVGRRNLWTVDCSGARAITLYAFPSMMLKLEQKLQAELPTGARVVSLSFAFPHWQPVLTEGSIRVYEK
jgi:hypothetical protein